eukprot:6194700-Pleurochrysis_carterae.AAC.2
MLLPEPEAPRSSSSLISVRSFRVCVVTRSIPPLPLHQPKCCPLALVVCKANINYAVHDECPLVFVSDARDDGPMILP